MSYHGQVLVTPPGQGAVETEIEVLDDALSFSSLGGQPEHLAFVDIDDVFDDNYTLRVTDYTGRRYDFSMLGKAYGQVVADVRKRRDKALQHDLLLTGVNLQDTYPARLFRGSGLEPVEIRLFEDLLVVVPERGLMFGVPYSYVGGVEWNDQLYQVTVRVEGDEPLVFGQMGKRTTQFRDDLEHWLSALRRKSAQTLSQLVPGFPPSQISELAMVMPDARAAQEKTVEAIDPELWVRLEEAVVGREDRRPAYEWLKARCPAGWAALGVKSAVFGGDAQPVVASHPSQLQPADENDSSTEDTQTTMDQPSAITWYFCPLERDGNPINVTAQEVTSESGHATYFFRLMDEDRFKSLTGEELAGAVSQAIARLNRGLATLNFRRQPIYLSDEAITHGAFARYRVALRKLDYLQWIRTSFLGRAIHDDTWEQQTGTILETA